MTPLNDTHVKDPDANLPYEWDWSGWLSDGETITAQTITADEVRRLLGPSRFTDDIRPDVDEVVRALRSGGATGDDAVAATAADLGIDARLVRIAVDYAAEHLEEIEARLRDNDEAAERVRRLTEARAAVLAE